MTKGETNNQECIEEQPVAQERGDVEWTKKENIKGKHY